MAQYNTRPVAKGLRNFGNTCFISATLQCLVNIPGINSVMLESRVRFRDPVGKNLISFFRDHNEDKERAHENLVNAVWGSRSKGFGRGQQHDSSEFLVWILDLMAEVFEEEPYRLRMRRQVVCGRDESHFWSQAMEEDRVITVTLPRAAIGYFGKNTARQTLVDALNVTFETTELEQLCETCEENTIVQQFRHVCNRPSILILSLKIFEQVSLLSPTLQTFIEEWYLVD